MVFIIIEMLVFVVSVTSMTTIHQFQILRDVDLDLSTFEVRIEGLFVSKMVCLSLVGSTSISSTIVALHEGQCKFKQMEPAAIESLVLGNVNAYYLVIPGLDSDMVNKSETIQSHQCYAQEGSLDEVNVGCGTEIFDRDNTTSRDFDREKEVKIILRRNPDHLHVSYPMFNSVAIQLEMSTSNIPKKIKTAWGEDCDEEKQTVEKTFSGQGFLFIGGIPSGELASGMCFSITFEMHSKRRRLTIQDIYYVNS